MLADVAQCGFNGACPLGGNGGATLVLVILYSVANVALGLRKQNERLGIHPALRRLACFRNFANQASSISLPGPELAPSSSISRNRSISRCLRIRSRRYSLVEAYPWAATC